LKLTVTKWRQEQKMCVCVCPGCINIEEQWVVNGWSGGGLSYQDWMDEGVGQNESS